MNQAVVVVVDADVDVCVGVWMLVAMVALVHDITIPVAVRVGIESRATSRI